MTDVDWRSAWASELDRLELDVERAEQMLRVNDPTPIQAWKPPVMHLAMPEDLVPRARLILERQLAVAHDIARAAAVTQQQLAYTRKVAGNLPPDIPVYLDVTA